MLYACVRARHKHRAHSLTRLSQGKSSFVTSFTASFIDETSKRVDGGGGVHHDAAVAAVELHLGRVCEPCDLVLCVSLFHR